MKYLQRTREALRQRWIREYLHALQERHAIIGCHSNFNLGAIVLITDVLNERKPEWRLAKVVDFIKGRDGVLRGVKAKCGNGNVVERPLQLIRNLEIPFEARAEPKMVSKSEVGAELDAKADADAEAKWKETVVAAEAGSEPKRLGRKAKSNAADRIFGIALNEMED
jgi:hypothetical protein